MVYCGKASQGCQGCRTRRIKCDKVKPQCSQCIRVGKKCPGYRDQLSLMFRDESSKVIQKAHAQWGVAEPSGPSSLPPAEKQHLSPAPSALLSSSVSGPPASRSPVANENGGAADVAKFAVTYFRTTAGANVASIPPVVAPSFEDQGIRFFLNNYAISHITEPKSYRELDSLAWLFHPALQDVMTAVGLAALSNLNGNQEMNTLSRRKYVNVLQHTGKILGNPNRKDTMITLRTAVLLALYEVVKGAHHSENSVNAHIMGAAALMRTASPNIISPAGGSWGLLQLSFALFIPCHAAGATMPPTAISAMEFANSQLPEPDRACGKLGRHICDFLRISSYVRNHVLYDGKRPAERIICELIDLDAQFDGWEKSLSESWSYETLQTDKLPATAAFRQKYHTYPNIWVARMWNHYRWARILTNELLLSFVEKCPNLSLMLVSARQQRRCFEIIRRLSEEILFSTPAHWRHPHLDEKAKGVISVLRLGGIGAVGVPALLHHLRVAGCSTGASPELFAWAYHITHSVWAQMGMLHARVGLDMMNKHKVKLVTEYTEE